MCHGGGFPSISGKALVGICIVFSPIIVPAAVIGGTAFVTKVAVDKTKETKKAMRTSNVLMKERNRAVKSIGAAKFNAYLREIHGRALAHPEDVRILIELAVAQYLSNDILGAHEVALDAIKMGTKNNTEATSPKSQEELGLAHYISGVILQSMPNYTEARKSFELCVQSWDSLPAMRQRVQKGESPDAPCKLRVTLSDAYNSLAFATQRIALLERNEVGDEFEPDAKAAMFRTAIDLHTKAIEVSEDVQGMYFHNRAVAKYFLALVRINSLPMLDGEDYDSYTIRAFSLADEALLRDAMKDWETAINSGNFGTTAEGHSMLAQSKTILGDFDGAALERETARKLDPKVFIIEGGPTEKPMSLISSWPVPHMLYDRHRDNHNWEKAKLMRPTWCDHCMCFITFNQAKGNVQRCTKCNYTCHAECHPSVKVKVCWNSVHPGFSCGDKVRHRAYENLIGVVTNVFNGLVDVRWDRKGNDETLERIRPYYLEIVEHTGDPQPSQQTHTHRLKDKILHKPTWCSLCKGFITGLKAKKCVDCMDVFHNSCEVPNSILE
jgi:hypothetical protein